MRNERIVRIETSENLVVVLTGKEAGMRRAFAADGIDADEQRRLDVILGKISQLKAAIKKERAEVEANKRAWEGRRNEHVSVQMQVGDLRDWPDPSAPSLIAECLTIEQATADERWKDASDLLDQVAAHIAPIYLAYELQVAAKADYDPLEAEYFERMEAALDAGPYSEDIDNHWQNTNNDAEVATTAAEANDYITALASLKLVIAEVTKLEEEIRTFKAQKAEYDAQWAALAPRLQDCGYCEFPDLMPMQQEIASLQDQIVALAAEHDYTAAIPMIADLTGKVDTYLIAFAEAVDERTLYEARLPGIKGRATYTSVNIFPELQPLVIAINNIFQVVQAAAANGDYDQALSQMDELVPLLETFEIDFENAQLGREFERIYGAMEPRFGAAAVCNYLPVEPLSQEIANDQQAAANAGSAGDYAGAIDILNRAAGKLDDYEARVAAIEQAKADYDLMLPGLLMRFDAIAQCEYRELDADQEAIVAMRTEMENAAGNGDYPLALTTLHDLERKIGIIETTLTALDAARNEYDIRLPAVISRLDGSMQSDYAELEDERTALTSLRGEMETAATATDFRLALTHMNALERMLNDLDAQLGNLINLQNQYEALYDQIKDKIAAVESCSHPELETKKTSILTLRDEMLAAATATDFATALQKSTALVGPLDEFAQLEDLLKDYTRRHDVIKPRLEQVRGFTYLSLKAVQEAIQELYGKMTEEANKAWLKEAVAKMTRLEKLVTDAIALNAELANNEPVYEKLHKDMLGKIEIIRKNDIEEAQAAADKVITAFDAMVKLGEEHEFVKAVKAADGVMDLIDAYLKKVDEFGDQKEAYEILRGMALEAYGSAQQKSTEYDDLKDPFDDLTTLKEAMESLAGEEKYGEAGVKAKALLAEIKTFDGKWVDLATREAAIESAAKAAIDRFNTQPGDAEDRAEDEYDKASSAKDKVEDALSEKDLDEAEDAVKKLNDALDDLEDALMTTGEHKAEYEGLLGTLTPRVEKANDSEFASVLTDELDDVIDAFDEMKDTAGNEDYEGAVGKAGAVEQALTAFDKAEDRLEQDKVRYDERWSGLETQYKQAREVTEKSLEAKVGKLPEMLADAQEAADAKDYQKGLDGLAKLRVEVEAILAEEEKIEDEKADESDDGIIERTGEKVDDLSDKVFDFVKDKAIDKAKDYVGKKVGIVGETLINVGEELLDGDPVDAAVEAAKGFVKAHPVTDAVETAVEIADDALDAMDSILGDDD